MQGTEAGDRCQKAVLIHSPMATSKAEGLEGLQEAGGGAGEMDSARRCDTAQVRVKRKDISLMLE